MTFEPTGGYEKSFREFLKCSRINFTTVHPNKVRSYAKAKGWLAKTDVVDAKLLADFATIFSLSTKQEYASEVQRKLYSLIQRREQLILYKTQEITRLETITDEYSIKSIKAHIKYLDKTLADTQKRIKDCISSSDELRSKVSNLTSIPGVGITLATNAICELPELDLLEFNKLTALVGLAPYARESGQFKGRRSIFAGRHNIRKVLYMTAVASLRCNKRLKEFYDRLIKNHKAPKVALVAVMRKLLSFMHIIIQRHTMWDEKIC